MIKLLPKSPDFITMQHFEDIEFSNCKSDAITFFFNPPEGWGNLNDCGLECDLEGVCVPFPCTGPKNTIFSFKNIKWTNGSENEPNALKDFSLIPHIATYTDQFPDCTKYDKINGHICQNNDLGILVWESQDPDSIDRSIQPIFLHYDNKTEH